MPASGTIKTKRSTRANPIATPPASRTARAKTAVAVDLGPGTVRITFELESTTVIKNKTARAPPITRGPIVFNPGNAISALTYDAFVKRVADDFEWIQDDLTSKLKDHGAWRFVKGPANVRNPLNDVNGWNALLEELKPKYDQGVRIYLKQPVSVINKLIMYAISR